jgi:hypothetical protein
MKNTHYIEELEIAFLNYCKMVMEANGHCYICNVLLNEENISMWYSETQPPTCVRCNEAKG